MAALPHEASSRRSEYLGLSVPSELGLAPFPASKAVEVLDRALQTDARLSELGRLGARADLQWQLDTLALGLPVSGGQDPLSGLIIAGLPRTGTTALHHMLASTGQYRHLSVLEALRPSVWAATAPDRAARRSVEEYAALRVASIQSLAPDLMRMHPVAETGPEECTPILQSTALCLQMPIMYRVPTFADWFLEQDSRGVYEYWSGQLRALTPHPEHDDRPWVLKCPLHFPSYRSLLDTVGCGVVQVRRDAVSWFHSFLNLVLLARSIFAEPDPIDIGREWLQRLPPLCTGAAEAVAEHPERFFTISFDHLRRDPVGVCEAILEWDPGHRRSIAIDRTQVRRAAADMARAHGAPPWPLGHFGIRAEQVERSFESSVRAGFFDAAR